VEPLMCFRVNSRTNGWSESTMGVGFRQSSGFGSEGEATKLAMFGRDRTAHVEEKR
jgi:hypothetical protein